jgi:beta-mannosidase
VEANVTDAATGALLAANTVLLVPPGQVSVPAGVAVAFAVTPLPPNADGSVNVTVTSTGSALFVTLTTLAQGRFSDNAFHLWGAGATATVCFVPWGDLDYGTLVSTLRVEHVHDYM